MSKQTEKDVKDAIEPVAEEIKKDAQAKVEEPKVPATKRTMCRLVSKADYIIKIKHNGQTTFIQPFGFAKVVKELVEVDRNDARYLTFVKL